MATTKKKSTHKGIQKELKVALPSFVSWLFVVFSGVFLTFYLATAAIVNGLFFGYSLPIVMIILAYIFLAISLKNKSILLRWLSLVFLVVGGTLISFSLVQIFLAYASQFPAPLAVLFVLAISYALTRYEIMKRRK